MNPCHLDQPASSTMIAFGSLLTCLEKIIYVVNYTQRSYNFQVVTRASDPRHPVLLGGDPVVYEARLLELVYLLAELELVRGVLLHHEGDTEVKQLLFQNVHRLLALADELGPEFEH